MAEDLYVVVSPTSMRIHLLFFGKFDFHLSSMVKTFETSEFNNSNLN